MNSVQWINDNHGQEHPEFGSNDTYTFDKNNLDFSQMNNPDKDLRKISGEASQKTTINNKIWLMGDYNTYDGGKTFYNIINNNISPSLWEQNGGIIETSIYNN